MFRRGGNIATCSHPESTGASLYRHILFVRESLFIVCCTKNSVEKWPVDDSPTSRGFRSFVPENAHHILFDSSSRDATENMRSRLSFVTRECLFIPFVHRGRGVVLSKKSSFVRRASHVTFSSQSIITHQERKRLFASVTTGYTTFCLFFAFVFGRLSKRTVEWYYRRRRSRERFFFWCRCLLSFRYASSKGVDWTNNNAEECNNKIRHFTEKLRGDCNKYTDTYPDGWRGYYVYEYSGSADGC